MSRLVLTVRQDVGRTIVGCQEHQVSVAVDADDPRRDELLVQFFDAHADCGRTAISLSPDSADGEPSQVHRGH